MYGCVAVEILLISVTQSADKEIDYLRLARQYRIQYGVPRTLRKLRSFVDSVPFFRIAMRVSRSVAWQEWNGPSRLVDFRRRPWAGTSGWPFSAFE